MSGVGKTMVSARTPCPRASAERVALCVYASCFTIGGLNHLRDFVVRGWRPYRFAPLPAIEAYWSALILLDVAVVVLLIAGRTRPALLLAVAIMASDVAVNVAATRLLGLSDFGWPLILQATFLGFVLGSIGFLWRVRRP